MTNTAVPTGLSLEIRRTFNAPREAVYAAWTKKDQLERWMCKDVPAQDATYAVLDARPGGRYVIEIPMPDGGMYRGSGVFGEMRPPEKIVFTWAWARVPEKPGEWLQKTDSLITIELFERGGATEMVFVQERMENEQTREDHLKGWEGCFRVLAGVL